MKKFAALIFLVGCWTTSQAASLPRRPNDNNLLDLSAHEDQWYIRRDASDTHLHQEDDDQQSSYGRNTGQNKQEDESSSSGGIFQSIMHQLMKGHVTQDSIAHWMSQIKTALAKGTISSENVNAFISTLKEKLAGTSIGDTCCPFG